MNTRVTREYRHVKKKSVQSAYKSNKFIFYIKQMNGVLHATIYILPLPAIYEWSKQINMKSYRADVC